MTKREAKRVACRKASVWVDNLIATGHDLGMPEETAADEEDHRKVTAALRELAQELYDRGASGPGAGTKGEGPQP
jgi:hypothetical protein